MEVIGVSIIILFVLVVVIGLGKYVAQNKREKVSIELSQRKNRFDCFISNHNLIATNPFNADYNFEDIIALDSKNRQIVVSDNSSGSYRFFDVGDILDIKKSYNFSMRNEFFIKAEIVFTVRDLDKPKVIVPFLRNKDRDDWFDKIRVLR